MIDSDWPGRVLLLPVGFQLPHRSVFYWFRRIVSVQPLSGGAGLRIVLLQHRSWLWLHRIAAAEPILPEPGVRNGGNPARLARAWPLLLPGWLPVWQCGYARSEYPKTELRANLTHRAGLPELPSGESGTRDCRVLPTYLPVLRTGAP